MLQAIDNVASYISQDSAWKEATINTAAFKLEAKRAAPAVHKDPCSCCLHRIRAPAVYVGNPPRTLSTRSSRWRVPRWRSPRRWAPASLTTRAWSCLRRRYIRTAAPAGYIRIRAPAVYKDPCSCC